MFLGSLSGTDSLRHDAWDKQVLLHKAMWNFRQALLLLRRDGRNKHNRIGIWTLGSDVEVAPKVHDKIQFCVLPFFLSNDVHTKKNPVFFYFPSSALPSRVSFLLRIIIALWSVPVSTLYSCVNSRVVDIGCWVRGVRVGPYPTLEKKILPKTRFTPVNTLICETYWFPRVLIIKKSWKNE